jgi:hypothetical protein
VARENAYPLNLVQGYTAFFIFGLGRDIVGEHLFLFPSEAGPKGLLDCPFFSEGFFEPYLWESASVDTVTSERRIIGLVFFSKPRTVETKVQGFLFLKGSL